MDNYDRDTEKMFKKINEKGNEATKQYIAAQNATKMVNPTTGIYTPFSNSNRVYEYTTSQTEVHKKVATKSIAKAPVKKNTRKKVDTTAKVIDLNKIIERAAAVLLVATIAIGISVPISKGIEIAKEKLEAAEKLTQSIEILKNEARFNLLSNGLAGIHSETGSITVMENSVIDYKKLGISENVDIYIYSLILPHQEFDKFIRSATYNNGINSYISTEQFFKINGFWDNKQDIPLWDVFENYMIEEIKAKQEEILNKGNNIYTFDTSSSNVEESSYTFDIDEKTRGGR